MSENTENTIQIGDNQYTVEELSSILSEREELKTKVSSIDPEVIEVGNYVRDLLSKGPDGVNELRSQLDIYAPMPKSTPEFNIEIDEDSASPNEVKLMKALKHVTDLLKNTSSEIHMTKAEMKKLVEDLAETTKIESTASAAAERVEAELGIKVSPTEIKEAIKKTGLKDPVDAIMITRKNDVLKGRNPSKPKPNFIQEQSSKRINLDDLSPMERIKVVREHPELLEGWTPKKSSY